MHARSALGLLLVLLVLPALATATPPDHAPAHGYRAKQAKQAAKPAPAGGVEVVFDSERGIYIGVGLPGIFFHDGRYYREHEGRWQVSLTGKSGWRLRAAGEVPTVVVQAAAKPHPGPAKPGPAKGGAKHRKGR